MMLDALSPAKINLFLNIPFKRSDGYHEVETVMLKLNWGDRIELHLNENIREVSMDVPKFPDLNTPHNLAYRAAQLYFSTAKVSCGLRIFIDKHIFMGGGLGGGSSNAGTVLRLLNQYFQKLNETQLLEIGAQLGSDVPFFVQSAPMAYCYGRGEKCEPLAANEQLHIVLLNPNIHVSTKEIYQALNRSLTSKTRDVSTDALSSIKSRKISLLEWVDRGNDMQDVVEALFPGVQKARLALLQEGADKAQMSGSGATVFSVFKSADFAQKAAKNLQQMATTVVTTSQM